MLVDQWPIFLIIFIALFYFCFNFFTDSYNPTRSELPFTIMLFYAINADGGGVSKSKLQFCANVSCLFLVSFIGNSPCNHRLRLHRGNPMTILLTRTKDLTRANSLFWQPFFFRRFYSWLWGQHGGSLCLKTVCEVKTDSSAPSWLWHCMWLIIFSYESCS